MCSFMAAAIALTIFLLLTPGKKPQGTDNTAADPAVQAEPETFTSDYWVNNAEFTSAGDVPVIHSYVPGRMIRLNLETMGFAGPEPRSRFLGDFEFVENNPARMEAEGHEHVYKYEVYSKDHALLERLRAELIEAGFSVSSSVPDDIEITAPGVDKGSGVMWLAEQIGATVDQTMAFGDHLNDMPMIKRVGWPVAMDNGVDELKAAARIIAPDAADDGVARVVRRHVFGENCL